jgi:WD40 repeat protein
VISVCVMNDGRVVSGSNDKTIKIWNPESGECDITLTGHTSEVTSVCVMNDGRVVL